MPDLEKQKQEFLTLCRENIKRDGLEDLLGFRNQISLRLPPAHAITVLMKAAYVSTPWMFTTWPRKQSPVMSLS